MTANTATTDPIDLADAIAPHITDTPQTPSQLARKAKIKTTEAYKGLGWMTENNYVIAVGKGCLTKYRARQFGEMN